MHISTNQSSMRRRALEKRSALRERSTLPVNIRKSSTRIEIRFVWVAGWINNSAFVLMYCSIRIDLSCAYVRDIRTAAPYQYFVIPRVNFN